MIEEREEQIRLKIAQRNANAQIGATGISDEEYLLNRLDSCAESLLVFMKRFIELAQEKKIIEKDRDAALAECERWKARFAITLELVQAHAEGGNIVNYGRLSERLEALENEQEE